MGTSVQTPEPTIKGCVWWYMIRVGALRGGGRKIPCIPGICWLVDIAYQASDRPQKQDVPEKRHLQLSSGIHARVHPYTYRNSTETIIFPMTGVIKTRITHRHVFSSSFSARSVIKHTHDVIMVIRITGINVIADNAFECVRKAKSRQRNKFMD